MTTHKCDKVITMNIGISVSAEWTISFILVCIITPTNKEYRQDYREMKTSTKTWKQNKKHHYTYNIRVMQYNRYEQYWTHKTDQVHKL